MLLSICIPTLNRVDFLSMLLSSLLPAAQELGVEVCVSDNASTDGTRDFLSAQILQYTCLSVRRSSVRMSIDESMLSVIAMGTGDYVFPLGDDDWLDGQSLQIILNALKRQDDLLVLNGWHTGPSLEKLRMHLIGGLAGEVYTRPNDAFSNLWDRMPFGSFIASRQIFEDGNGILFAGTSHAYSGVVWDGLAQKYDRDLSCSIYCLPAPVVLLRGAEKTWEREAVDILVFQIADWFRKVAARPIYFDSVKEAVRAYGKKNIKLSKLVRYRLAGKLKPVDFFRLWSLWPIRRVSILISWTLPIYILKIFRL